ncbi:aldehyde dehydrogenase family protein [Cereibacter sphaeroides]|uniref:Aldehyde dehydrogenase family protein n=1 Tax=Cereibacter sphaeroides TaxID=1063 RepID=A0AAX1UGE8_CERSP|nr:aldehyde dehydrogenase family protein [Cereibacter sphaeroides]
MNEDPFGPVAIPNRFDTLDAAITEANRLPFGLAAYGCTRSEAVACRLPVEAKAGMMTITHPGLALPEVPFDGLKEPGYGTEGGSQALDACFDTRFVSRKA